MADLDDFFAKKDKKKSKGKKFTTTDEVAKKLEETGKRVIEKPKLREKSTNNPEEEGGETPQIEEEEEWREFEEEKKDYTGLKIGNLQVSDNLDGDSDDERGTGNNSEENESGEAGSSATGPWNKKDGAETDVSTNSSTATTTAAAAPAPPAPATGPAKAYKPPSLRNPEKMPLGRSRMRNVAPDIRSEEYFPQLSGKQQSTQDSSNTWGRRKRDEGSFEEVRNRGSSKAYSLQDAQSQAPKLSLDNKYGALSQDQS